MGKELDPLPDGALFPASEASGHDAGAATTVNDGYNPQRFFLGRIGNQIITYLNEAQRPGGEVGASVALTGERHKVIESFLDFGSYAVCGGRIIGGDVFRDFVKIGFRFRVKRIAGHEPGFTWRASLLARSRAKTSSPGMAFTLPLFRSS